MAIRGKIPGPVISRLTRYLTCAQVMLRDGRDWVSSQDFAEALRIHPATIRRDLSYVDSGGVKNRGHSARQLCDSLSDLLGVRTGWRALVVGAGNLGKALALHGDLARQGFVICAVFDTDGRKIGTRIGSLAVRPMDELPRVILEAKIQIGIIAVPSRAAQPVADILIASGIRGLFNLSLTHLVVPATVRMVEGRLVAGMIELGYAIKNNAAALPRGGARCAHR